MKAVRHICMAFTALGLLLMAAGPALACPVLESADPRVGGTLAASPASVTLHFSGPVELDRSRLDVRDAAGALVSKGALRQDSQDAATVGIGLKPLPPGRYKVHWSIRCHCQEDEDTAIPGSYSFTIAP